jgi:hypothetical protein
MKMLFGILTVAVLGGCAFPNPHGYYIPPPRPATGTDYQPLIDNPGPNHSADLYQCQQIASSESKGSDVAVGSVVGALVGLGVDAVSGGGHALGYSAMFASTGGLGGYANASANQKNIVINCMRGRGYNVLR